MIGEVGEGLLQQLQSSFSSSPSDAARRNTQGMGFCNCPPTTLITLHVNHPLPPAAQATLCDHPIPAALLDFHLSCLDSCCGHTWWGIFSG